MKDRKFLIVGGNSAIGFEVARRLAERGARLFLLGRDEESLKRNALDLGVRSGIEVGFDCFDAFDTESHSRLWEKARDHMGGLDGLLIAHGFMGDQAEDELDYKAQEKVLQVNFLGAVTFLTLAADDFARQGHGLISAISSPAGDRGRKKNYIYGAAKGALSIYLSGLRQRLSGSGVKVLTIKPGFVRTPMTEGLKLPLVVDPARVSEDIVLAMEKGKDELYTPFFWRYIMLLIKSIPEVVFKRLSI